MKQELDIFGLNTRGDWWTWLGIAVMVSAPVCGIIRAVLGW